MQSTRTYRPTRCFGLIEEVAVGNPGITDKYGHKYKILLFPVHIKKCVRKSNDAGSLEH